MWRCSRKYALVLQSEISTSYLSVCGIMLESLCPEMADGLKIAISRFFKLCFELGNTSKRGRATCRCAFFSKRSRDHYLLQKPSNMVDCAFYLLSIPPKLQAADLLRKIKPEDVLLQGVPHGWVLQPHSQQAKPLLSQDWNLFLLTKSSSQDVDSSINDLGASSVKGIVSIPQSQYHQLVSDVPKPATPSNDTPPLPSEWSDGQNGKIPNRHVLPPKKASLHPGELKLYEPMATYLSTTLPEAVRQKPVSLFNLFKYRDGDSSVHEHYMQGFKEKFGPAAGAQLKFMGPLSSQPQLAGEGLFAGSETMGWQDANLVQYDSIWHYAYMLSTEVYAELNKEKVEGLEDTCILLISETELQR